MTVDEVYKLMLFIMGKNQSGNLTRERFGIVINQASRSYFSFLVGQYQQYQYGRAISRVTMGQNQHVRTSLTPFIGPPATLTVAGDGLAAYPGDYQLWDAMWKADMSDRIRFVQQDSLYSYLDDDIDPIATNPIYLLEDDGFRFYPNDIGSAKLSYIKKHPDIVWGFSIVNNREVYDSGTSQDPLWNDADILEVVSRALTPFQHSGIRSLEFT